MSRTTTKPSTIEDFLRKTAEAATTEAGGMTGPTSHPSKGVDDKTKPANTGARAQENAKTVKEEVGTASVDATKEATGASGAASDQIQVGTKKAPTGEDPKNETAGAKGGLKDPGTSHPARVDNDSLNGGKYANDDFSKMSTEKLAAAVADLGNTVLAEITLAAEAEKTAAAQAASQPAPAQSQNAADLTKLSAQAGWDLAGLVNGSFDKRAADSLVMESLAATIDDACDKAVKVASILVKAAEGSGEFPPSGDSQQLDPGAVAASGQGHADAADDAAGNHAEPDGDEGVPPELAELIAQLEAQGVTPEELEAALAEGGESAGREGGGAGVPVAPPAAPPPAGGDAGGMQVAAADAAATAKVKSAALDMLREIVTRSRAKTAAAAAAKATAPAAAAK